MKTFTIIIATVMSIAGYLLLPFQSNAQEITVIDTLTEVVRAKVVTVLDERETTIPGTLASTTVQTIRAQLLEGERAGDIVEITNDYYQLREGQYFFANRMPGEGGEDLISVRDLDRRTSIVVVVALFAGVIVMFGGKQGLRSLLSLVLSFLVILFVLLPLLRNGYPPVLTSVLVGSVVLASAVFLTHGISRRSLIAFAGTVGGVLATGIFAWLSVWFVGLSGFATDDTVYLNFSSRGLLDLKGILLGSIIIGVLGVLDDIAITQVAVVSELKHVAKDISTSELFKKAMRVGKEHVSALVNTLVLAYTGVSLPLLLLFTGSEASFMTIINQELFATEIVRTIVGSIGLLLTVPLSTLLAAVWLRPEDYDPHGHLHSHHH